MAGRSPPAIYTFFRIHPRKDLSRPIVCRASRSGTGHTPRKLPRFASNLPLHRKLVLIPHKLG